MQLPQYLLRKLEFTQNENLAMAASARKVTRCQILSLSAGSAAEGAPEDPGGRRAAICGPGGQPAPDGAPPRLPHAGGVRHRKVRPPPPFVSLGFKAEILQGFVVYEILYYYMYEPQTGAALSGTRQL